MSIYHMFLQRNKKNILWIPIPALNWSYAQKIDFKHQQNILLLLVTCLLKPKITFFLIFNNYDSNELSHIKWNAKHYYIIPIILQKSETKCCKSVFKFQRLTLKAPRKTASENVVCLCCLLNILADFLKKYFCIQANSVDPDQNAPDLGPHCLQKWLLKPQAADKADDNS